MAAAQTTHLDLNKIAYQVGLVLDNNRQLFQNLASLQVMTKETIHGHSDFVTSLDLTVENNLKIALHQLEPTIPIFAEESLNDPAALDEAYCFVIDPIDGTQELIAGRTSFSTSIALLKQHRPVLGILDFPLRDQRLQAIRHAGLTFNGRPHHLTAAKSSTTTWQVAMSPFQFESPTLAPLRHTLASMGAKIAPLGALTTKVVGVALGHLDAAFFIPTPGKIAAIWDFAAAGLILEEAGGYFSTLAGDSLLTPPPLIQEEGWVAANQAWHTTLLAQLQAHLKTPVQV